MPIQINITTESAALAQNEMRKLLFGDHPIAEGPADPAELPASKADGAEATETAAPKKRVRAKKVEPEPEPEETVESDDELEIDAQDADDEQTLAADSAEGELSHDDVRTALANYRKKYGMGPTQIDGAKVLTMLFKNVTMISEIPTDQKSLAKAVAGIEELLEKNPFKRQAVA